jgi:hypothetical protein
MVLIELSGHPAVRIIELGKPDKGMRWLMIVDNTAYIVAYAASPPERFPDWLHTAQMIANSYSIYIRLVILLRQGCLLMNLGIVVIVVVLLLLLMLISLILTLGLILSSRISLTGLDVACP